ncbi:hypothetical protein [Paenibacillus sp. IHBB 3054]|uniref:hypothetical protein n=1 Tax=Paenibacillus sp. IHBB 3054 TaxID=3425689 RepID=UPI003F679907
MSVTQMQESTAGEVIHLFNTIRKFGATCSVEMKLYETSDSIMASSNQYVFAEYLEANSGEVDGDSIIVRLGEAEFCFELGKVSFSKDITNHQIDVLIASDSYAIWFCSSGLSIMGAAEARNYRTEPEDPLPQIKTDGDMYYATLSICAGLKAGEYDHMEATTRIFAAFADYMLKIMQEGQGNLQ